MVDRRRLLEVLKWVPPEDTLSHTATVSRLWFQASENEEVWASLYTDFHFSPNRPENQSFKSSFQAHVQRLLPVLTETSVKFYDCRKRTFAREIRFQKKLKLRTCALVKLPFADGVFVYQGGFLQAALLISYSGLFSTLHPSHNSQKRISAAYLHPYIYIFGWATLRSEKLKIAPIDGTRNWKLLPNPLLDHQNSGTCVYKTQIFIYGGERTNKGEVFDTETEAFALLPFIIPGQGSECVSYMQKGEFVIIAYDFLSYWSPDNKSRRMKKCCGSIWTCAGQVLIGNCLYKADYKKMIAFDFTKQSEIAMKLQHSRYK